jgi:hypothetical protein
VVRQGGGAGSYDGADKELNFKVDYFSKKAISCAISFQIERILTSNFYAFLDLYF